MEMHLLLGPVSLAVLCTLTMLVVLGPHAFRFIAAHDFDPLANIATLLLALFPLSSAWALGTVTLRGERYAFGPGFSLALVATVCVAQLGVTSVARLVLLGLAPVWLFIAHMLLLQARLRLAPSRVRTSTPSAS